MACSSSSSSACGARCHTLYASTRACGMISAVSSATRAATSGSATNSAAVLLDFGAGRGDDLGDEQDGTAGVLGHLLVGPVPVHAQDPLGCEEQVSPGAGHAGAIVM